MRDDQVSQEPTAEDPVYVVLPDTAARAADILSRAKLAGAI